MNIENDPRLTAYALGELGAQERSIFEKELANAGGAEATLSDIRDYAERLREAYSAEPVYAMTHEQRSLLLADAGALPVPIIVEQEIQHSDKVLPWVTQPVISEVDTQKIAEALKPSRWSQVVPILGSLGVAAGIVWVAAVVLMNQRPDPAKVSVAKDGDGEMEPMLISFVPPPKDSSRAPRRVLAGLPPYRYGAPLETIAGTPVADDLFDPAYLGHRRSSFPVVDGAASFKALRQYINAGKLPPTDAIRVAELLNAFDYGYALPTAGQVVFVDTELASCPWAPDRQLLQIGVRASQSEPSATAAEGVSMAVEFNPTTVAGYRLIGETESPDTEDDGVLGEASLASGQSVTALYEVLPRNPERGAASIVGVKPDEMVTVRVDYTNAEAGEGQSLEATVADSEAGISWREASDDFRFAASVAGYGMLLGGQVDKPLATYDLVHELARDAVGNDPEGKRKEFLQWVEKTMELKAEEATPVPEEGGPMLASPPKAPKRK